VPGGPLLVDGEVTAARAPAELRHSWRVHFDPRCAGEVSEVTWRIERRGEATKLTLIHELASAPATAENVGSDGWSMVLSGLKTLLETGEPLAVGRSA
jgi:hypothetical protein